MEKHQDVLSLRPGLPNIAALQIGSRPDAFAFELHGADEAWQPELYRSRSWLGPFEERLTFDTDIEEPAWHRFPEAWAAVHLLLHPPANATPGELTLVVHEHSSGRKVHVDFILETGAQGPGCIVTPSLA